MWLGCTNSKDPAPVDTDPPAVETADTATEPPPPVDTDVPPPVTTGCGDAGAEGLAKACDFSVNYASATIDEAAPGKPLSLTVEQSSATPPGSYNGRGTGNRSVAGFHDYDRLALTDLQTLAVDMEFISGSQLLGPEIGLILDLQCDSADLYYAIVKHADLGAGEAQGGGINRYTVTPESRVWSVNNELPDPAGGGLIIAPDPDLNPDMRPAATLEEIIGSYPSACLRNIDSGDPAMPLAAETSGILLTLGESTTILRVIWHVHRMQINDDVLQPPQ
jgi:hypothetical protein